MDSLKQIYTQLEKLAETHSTLEKKILLKEYMNNQLFKLVIIYALSETKQFGIKKTPLFETVSVTASPEEKTLKNVFTQLKTLSTKAGCTDIEKNNLFKAASIDKETFEVVCRICKKDLRCGVSYAIVNDVSPNTIVVTPYMRCSGVDKITNLNFEEYVFAQEKADGMFAYLFLKKVNNDITILGLTRNGNKLILQNVFINEFNKEYKEEHQFIFNRVYMGELLVLDKEGNPADRKTGNGILNKLIQGTISEEESKLLTFNLWDTVTISEFTKNKSESPYAVRYKIAQDFCFLVNSSKLKIISTTRVNSIKEAYNFYNKIVATGKEGIVLKAPFSIWKDGTSQESIKLKNVSEAELRITGIEKGAKGTKYEKCMGALVCETQCQQLEVRIGTGFSDQERDEPWEDRVGEIIEVKYNEIIKSKNKDKASLFLPRFSKRRLDKSEADTLAFLEERDTRKKKTK